MDAIKKNEFPKGWLDIVLDDILLTLESGKRPEGGVSGITEGIPSLGGEHLNFNGKFNVDNMRYVPTEFASSMLKGQIQINDILVVKDGATTGKTSFVSSDFPFKNAVINEHIFLCRTSRKIDQKFVFYFMWSSIGQKRILSNFKGTAQGGINTSFVHNTSLPIAPRPEQHRIVAKIEELFSELDNGIESLKKAREQLKTYRQAVLKHAFEGKLTKEWRTQQIQSGNPPEPEELPELPEGWKCEQIKEITTVLGDGLHGTPIYSDEGDYYFINGNNLSDGKIEIKENTNRVTIEEYEKYKKPLSENTVLVSINGTLGNTAFYNGEKVILGKSACYFNLLNAIDKHYIRYYITSQRFINYAYKNATGSTIKNVSLKAMREFEIPIPPTLEEQQAIVSEIESRLSVCDQIEQTIEDSLKKAEALRQSILKKAFAGDLTKDWREKHPELITGENSAEKLLEKIKTEKALSASGRKKPRSRKTKKK